MSKNPIAKYLKIETYLYCILLNGLFHTDWGLRTYLFENPPRIFRFFTLLLEIPDKTKLSPIETPQNCVTYNFSLNPAPVCFFSGIAHSAVRYMSKFLYTPTLLLIILDRYLKVYSLNPSPQPRKNKNKKEKKKKLKKKEKKKAQEPISQNSLRLVPS